MATRVDPRDYGFNPSYLSPNLNNIKSQLSPKFLLSGEIGIDTKLFDQNYSTFFLSRSQLNDLFDRLIPSWKTTEVTLDILKNSMSGS